jgi:Predicted membrane protein
MAFDSMIVKSVTPADLIKLMRESGAVAVSETSVIDGKPVIHAALVKANAKTGEMLPGGLPFSAVLHRGSTDKGYTNLAIGTIVPAAELGIELPPDFFNYSNHRLRFVRVYPVDTQSFAIQMDLVLRFATREYLKFAFGLWGTLYSQILFELVGKEHEALALAAEAFAATHRPAVLMPEPELASEPQSEPVSEPEIHVPAVVEPVESLAEPVADGVPAAVDEVAPPVESHAIPDAAVETVTEAEPAVVHEPAAEEITKEASVPAEGLDEAAPVGDDVERISADAVTEPVAQSVAAPAAEAVTEPAPESVAEPVTESGVEAEMPAAVATHPILVLDKPLESAEPVHSQPEPHSAVKPETVAAEPTKQLEPA